jgi:hypothetical protein
MAKATKKRKDEDVDDEPVKKKGKGKGATVIFDFSEVEEGGGRTRVKEGDYRAKIVKVEQKDSQAGNSMLVVTYEILEGKKTKGKKLVDRCMLTGKGAFRLRNLLQAIGKDTGKVKRGKLNYLSLVDEELIVTAEDEEYDNKMYSKVSDYMSLDDVDDEDEDDDEESEEEDDEDVDEVDLDEI